ncbi:zinc-binding alcohol dehydrogenase family protein [Pseudoduganella umbonata]|uniref:Zinc-type alcohol dehydrogenase-like protein n=1 Tax=Pseudoduganella umbonata TaxID=864828 RepID=A0A4V1ED46_9BURK|nr:zinc-binding alcohol dehydrogenase family protein [Pseudoduganella umbonata]MBB3219769.1 zinc-binding alcohol dehydrogenase family protein [Pseudoduganella umbonata]QCP09811.1 zinc-binding alcohol dehydrogenase family protein [Pseudoduganella umbonata]
MKAIVYTRHGLPIEDPESLVEMDLPDPEPGPRDLLVRVHAVSVNPVDTKVRRGAAVTAPRVVGWDAAGIVEAVGSDVTAFRPGDAVYYAGSLTRPGSYSELHLVDERIVGRKPASLGFADAAALPLTSLTAWELLFDRLKVPEQGGQGRTLLVIGASGGVGSILTQLAARLTGVTVIGTASRPETADWVRELGAHHVIDHSQPMKAQLQGLGHEYADIVISLTHTDQHYADIVDILAPQGQFALIDDPDTLDAMPLKRKSISLHWELMFTRSMYETADMARQREILDRVAALVDSGELRTTVGEHIGKIDAANLRRAHAVIESGKARGKLVLAGF